jgi:hypothetical protein
VTEPAQSGGPSPLRVGGLALVGAGAVAALIGLATLLPGGGSSTPAAPTTTPTISETAVPTPAPAPTSAVAAPNEPVPVPSFAPTPTNAVAAPNGTAPGTAGTAGTGGSGTGTGSGSGSVGGSGGGSGVVEAPVRVYNNSTITGLAARAADDFRADGWQVKAVSNYPSGIIATSTVYYRPGTSEQSAASSLGSQFGLRVEPRFVGIDDATPGLIVIVTNDYQKR